MYMYLDRLPGKVAWLHDKIFRKAVWLAGRATWNGNVIKLGWYRFLHPWYIVKHISRFPIISLFFSFTQNCFKHKHRYVPLYKHHDKPPALGWETRAIALFACAPRYGPQHTCTSVRHSQCIMQLSIPPFSWFTECYMYTYWKGI